MNAATLPFGFSASFSFQASTGFNASCLMGSTLQRFHSSTHNPKANASLKYGRSMDVPILATVICGATGATSSCIWTRPEGLVSMVGTLDAAAGLGRCLRFSGVVSAPLAK